MIIPSKYSSQARTLKLYVNLRHNQQYGSVIPLQRLKSTILLPKTFRKTYLVILQAANTFYALILILITQKYTDIDVNKILIQPLSCACFHSFISYCHFFAQIIQIFLFFGANPYKPEHQQSNSTLTNNAYQNSSLQNSGQLCIRGFTL